MKPTINFYFYRIILLFRNNLDLEIFKNNNEINIIKVFSNTNCIKNIVLNYNLYMRLMIFVIHNTSNVDPEKKVVYFMSIEEAQFRKPVVPGDALYLHVEKVKNRGNVWKMKGEARVDGQRVANATFSAMIVDKNKEV